MDSSFVCKYCKDRHILLPILGHHINKKNTKKERKRRKHKKIEKNKIYQ
jgi:hypothetical protein